MTDLIKIHYSLEYFCLVEPKTRYWYCTNLFRSTKMNRYSTVQRPEAALQRANDFISVGKEADALNALYEIIKVRSKFEST